MSSREPYTRSDDDHLVQYLAKYHPLAHGRLGQKVYMNLTEMSGSDWVWTKRHSWQSWRERYKKNQDRMDAKISALLKVNGKNKANGKNQPSVGMVLDAPVMKREATEAKRVDGAVKKEGMKPKVEGKEKQEDQGKRISQAATASQSVKTSQEVPSSSLTMPPPAQRPVRTPVSTMDSNVTALPAPTPTNIHVTSDNYDHELFRSQQQDENTDDGAYHDIKSTSSSDDEEVVARPSGAVTRTAEMRKKVQGQNGNASRAPPAQPRPSQSQVSRSNLARNKRTSKQDEEDIFADASPSSTPGPSQRPPPSAIVTVKEGAFRRTIKRARESAGDPNWPPKRQKNAILNVDGDQQQNRETYDNRKADVSRQQLTAVVVKPKQAPPAVASSSRTRLEDMPPPRRPTSPLMYRPGKNSKTYTTRKSDESDQVSRNVHIAVTEVPARTRISDPLPHNATTHQSENRPPKLDFKLIRKSRRSLLNSTSSRASNISSRSSIASRSRQPSRRSSLEFQAPHLQHQARPSRPRQSAIELASTQDVNLFAELGLHQAITLIAQEYGFNTDFTRVIYEQTRDLEYTKFMLKRFQEAVRVEADFLVERFPVLLWENREEEGAQMEMPSVEEFVVSDEENASKGKGRVKEQTRQGSNRPKTGASTHTSPSTPSQPPSLASSQKKLSHSRSRQRPSQTLASVIRPISPGELSMMRDDVSDYDPPGKSRAGTFVRLERRGLIDEAIELEKRRVSGQYEKKRRNVHRSDDDDVQEKGTAKETEDRMEVDQEQREDHEYVVEQEEPYEDEEGEEKSDWAQDDEDDDQEGQKQDHTVELLEDEEQGDEEEHEADADDEHENEDDQGGSIISQNENEEQEVDELEEELFADIEGSAEPNGDFDGLFTQVNTGEGGQEELDDDEDDMYVSQELQPPPAALDEENGEQAPAGVKLESADLEIAVDPQSYQHAQPEQTEGRTEHENQNQNELEEDADELTALADKHYELTGQVTEDNSETLRRFEVQVDGYNRDVLKEWSLEWAARRLTKFR